MILVEKEASFSTIRLLPIPPDTDVRARKQPILTSVASGGFASCSLPSKNRMKLLRCYDTYN